MNVTSYQRVFTCEKHAKGSATSIKHLSSNNHALRIHFQPRNRRHGKPRFVSTQTSTIVANRKSPVEEIPAVIHLLTQSPPSLQRATIEKYFTPDAAFSHPFCRTWSGPNSRWLVEATYRWYKIMSPRIDLTVQSVGALHLQGHMVYTGLDTDECWQRSMRQT
jgi:hypothetical protein